MSGIKKENIQSRLKSVSKISAVIIGILGMFVIIGWFWDIPFLKSIVPTIISMKFNTALCFLISGITLWILNNKAVSLVHELIFFCGLSFILSLSALNLYEYFFQTNIGIDELFMKDDLLLVETTYPGRMASLTAIDFILFTISSVFIFFKMKYYKILNALSLFLLATSLFSILEYLYNVEDIYNLLFSTKMALHTSIGFFVISVGLLTAQGEKGIISFFTSDNIGGAIARRLIPLMIFILLFLGWIQLQGEKYGWYKSEFGVAIFTLINITIIISIVLGNTQRLIFKEEKQKEAELLLKESQKVARIGSYKTDFKIGFWESSEVLDEIFGIDKVYLRSVNGWLNIVHPDEQKKLKEYLNEEVIAKKEKFNKEYKIRRVNDGVERWVHGLGEVTFDKDNNLLSMIGTIQDITERKLAEFEKWNADTLIRTLSLAIEQSPVTVVITDIDGKIEFVNPKFTEATGYTSEEITGQNSRILKSDFINDLEYKELWNTILSGKNWYGVFHNKKKNGELFWESAVISPVKDEQGRINHFLAVKEDITQNILMEEKRKEAEEQLKEHADLLSSKNIQLTDFCNIVSHNLRGPLVNISMLVDFIEKAKNEEERMEIIEKFKPVVNNLHESFNELVESLQVRNDAEVKTEKIILADCLQKILDGMKAEINLYGASFEVNIGDTPFIIYPPNYLSSVLFNLISNSIKYRSAERKPIIKIKTEKTDRSIVLSVEDNCLGIDLNEHGKNLFKIRKVFHEHPDAKGFGLFMTKTQVEAMSGKIWAESTPGVGTTFFVEFKNQN